MELQAGGKGGRLSRTCPTGFLEAGLTRAEGSAGSKQSSDLSKPLARLSRLRFPPWANLASKLPQQLWKVLHVDPKAGTIAQMLQPH